MKNISDSQTTVSDPYANKNKRVYVDSNIMQNPDCFEQLSDKYHDSVFRDFLIFVLSQKKDKSNKIIEFHLADFYQTFNIDRGNLFRDVNKNLNWQKYGFNEAPSVIEWVLFRLTAPLQFVEYRSDMNREAIEKAAKAGKKNVNINFVRLLTEQSYESNRGRFGINPEVQIEPRVIANTRGKQYIEFLLSDYLKLKTEKLRPDQNLRKLFMRMAWKEQVESKKSYQSSTENFSRLCQIAGMKIGKVKTPVRKMAYQLRDMFDKISRETTLTSRWEVEKKGKHYVVNVYKKVKEKAA